MNLPPALSRVLKLTPCLSKAFLVGGCVRDSLLDVPIKDFDVEVYGVSYETLTQQLASHGRTDTVGRSFGVAKLQLGDGHEYDFSIPRRDSKTAPGHKGFHIEFDPSITPQQAAARRDFTINALMLNPRTGSLLDFFDGQNDLRRQILRHTTEAFVEDPLRVLRGMQFAARFDLQAADDTVALCRSIRHTYPELAIERVREEWFKWAAKSRKPSRGLNFLRQTGWIETTPEIQALIGTPQEAEWHPEGDVFVHTCHCLDALVQLEEWQSSPEATRVVLSLAVLAHDFAKPATTRIAERDGRYRIVSPGHEEAGGPLAESFLQRIGAPLETRSRVVPLVTNHLAHLQTSTDRAVRRLANRLQPETIEHLCIVIEADQYGRPPRPKQPSDSLLALRNHAKSIGLRNAAPRPILLGRHLIDRGMKPSPAFKPILDAAFEAQLEGDFHDLAGALDWLSRNA